MKELYATIKEFPAIYASFGNVTVNSARPKELPALWRVKHTTDPEKAKPWVKPTSTSDIYLMGECMIWTDGFVYKALRDTNFSPEEYAPDWQKQ